MVRWKLTLEYHGGPFAGWQRQENGPSVQASLEAAITGFCGESVTVAAAGRTDAGVHALGQVAHADILKEADADTVRDALNFHLKPDPIAVVAVEAAAPDFHARFQAVQRHYLYRIRNRRAPLTLDRGLAWQVAVPLDAEAMHAAAQVLVGKHDFTTFRHVHCQSKSPVKSLTAISVVREGDAVAVSVRAPSFLHNQVRSIVGSLKLVGEGKWRDADLGEALAAQDRTRCGPVAPAHGLFLKQVDYREPAGMSLK